MIDLPNVGFLLEKLNPFLFQRLRQEVAVFIEDYQKGDGDKNHDLLRQFHKRKAGYSSDYTLSEKLVEDLKKEVLKHIEQLEGKFNYFDKIFNFTVNVEGCELQLALERIWTNFQSPGEFLPLHNHTGVYSFVIWVYVPFDMAAEKDLVVNQDLIKSRQGNFEFIYTDSLGKISSHTLPVDRKFEGVIAVFPSDLYHQVYPFYSSDGVRVSVAGNFRLEIVKKHEL